MLLYALPDYLQKSQILQHLDRLLGKLNTHEGLQGTYALLIKRYMRK